MGFFQRYKRIIVGVLIFWGLVMGTAYILGSGKLSFLYKKNKEDIPTVSNRYINGIIEVESNDGRDIHEYQDNLVFSIAISGSPSDPFKINICEKALDNCIWLKEKTNTKRTYGYRFVNDERQDPIFGGRKYNLVLNGEHALGKTSDAGYSQTIKLVSVPESGVLIENFRLVINQRYID